MKRLESVSVWQLFQHPTKALRRWWRKPSVKSEFIERGFFVMIAVICGYIIASTNIVTTIVQVVTRSNMAQTAIQQQAVTITPTTTESSSHQQFSSTPSWSQDFRTKNSGVPDPKYWNTLVGPALNSNNEQQYYSNNPENLRVENGALRFIATNSSQLSGYKYGSARLETEGKMSFLYGRFDITAKLPKGVGTWPALWLLPADHTYASLSPEGNPKHYKNGGEIDIIEAVGSDQNTNYGIAHTVSDVLLRSDGTGSYAKVSVPNSTEKFHTYSLLWTPTSLTFEVDAVAYYTYTRQKGSDYQTWPFDQPFYLIANLAIGGTWGAMDKSRFASGIDDSALPASFDIQSIMYYAYIGSTAVE